MEERHQQMKQLLKAHQLNEKVFDIETLCIQSEAIRKKAQKLRKREGIYTYEPIFAHYQRRGDR